MPFPNLPPPRPDELLYSLVARSRWIPKAVAPRLIREVDSDESVLLRLASSASELMAMPWRSYGLSDLRAKYMRHAVEQGYATPAGSVQWHKLRPEVLRKYSRVLLERLHCSLPASIGNRDHWITELLHTPKYPQMPIRHLLLMDFFGLSCQQFFETPALAVNPDWDAPSVKVKLGDTSVTLPAVQLSRSQWREAVREHPAATRTELIKVAGNGKAYYYLYTYDRKWLQDNSPPSRRRPPRGPTSKVVTQDATVAGRIRELAAKTRKQPDFRRRISEFWILRTLGVQSSVKHLLDRMPLTEQALVDCVETPEQYAVRRITLSAAELRARGQPITTRNLLRLFHLDDSVAKHPTVVEAINNEAAA